MSSSGRANGSREQAFVDSTVAAPPPPRAWRASRSPSGEQRAAMTTSQLKAALRERGIEAPEGATRGELLKLEAEASGSSNGETAVAAAPAARTSSIAEKAAIVEQALAHGAEKI